MNSAAGASDDTDAAMIRNVPVPTTAAANTVERGRRPWSHRNVTTPNAAPNPSAVMSTPNAALPPESTSFAKEGPSGIMAPPPMSPKPRPMITPRTSGFLPMNCSPSLMSRKVSGKSMRRPGARSRFGNGSCQTITADTRNVIASNINASAS